MTYDTFNSPIGLLYIVESNDKLFSLGRDKPNLDNTVFKTTPLSSKVKSWLTDYFNQCHRPIDFNLQLHGTTYQEAVFKQLLEIPYGHTITYGELAKTLQSGPRAVGGAVGKNDHLIVIPCHRVVGRHSIGGFSEDLSIKAHLLNLEKR